MSSRISNRSRWLLRFIPNDLPSSFFPHLTRDGSFLSFEITAPPRTAGMPPPGCTEAPTRHSHGRLRSLYRGRCNGPLLQNGRTAPYSAPPALPQAPKYSGSRISHSPKYLVAGSL